ncbi:MAG: GTP-binding protein, partial [Victivallales bacterium]|nr:GTP-binding protein [Victivallales bacterium]
MSSDLSHIRNLGIIAHIDAGKTSTTEGLLFFSGLTHRYGNIDDGTTVMDFLPDERARGITIMAAAATIRWKDCEFHLIDTPGHIDFTAEVERSLRAIDGAVVIFSAVEGVEAQSEKVWHQADGYGVPKIAFINKMDRIGASYTRTCESIDLKFSKVALPMQLPD